MAHVVLAGVAAAALTAGPAVAETTDPAKVEELIRKANELRRQGQDARAVPLLREAYDSARTPRTAAQLGLVELALGYWVAAEEHLNEALTSVKHHPFVDKNREPLAASLVTARSHIAELMVVGKPDGAEVVLNGKVAGTLPLSGALKVNEGRLDVEIRAAGRQPLRRTLSLGGEAREELKVDLPPAAAAADVARGGAPPGDGAGSGNGGGGGPGAGGGGDRPPSAPDGSATWRRVLPWSLVGATAVAAGIGVWQHVRWRSTQGDFESIPGCGASAPMHGADARCDDLYGDLTGQRTAAYVSYGVATALAAGATTFFILNARAGRIAAPSGGGAAGVGLTARPGEVKLSYRLSF